jgi:hypothetical protein
MRVLNHITTFLATAMDPTIHDANGRRCTIVRGPTIPHETRRRVVFEGEGKKIYAWPCGGSVIIKENADIVDMAFLGFDRFAPPTHRFADNDQDKEDDFARELLKIGGKFRRSPRRSADVGVGWKEAEGEERIRRSFGWDPRMGPVGCGPWNSILTRRIHQRRRG